MKRPDQFDRPVVVKTKRELLDEWDERARLVEELALEAQAAVRQLLDDLTELIASTEASATT